MKYTSAKAWLAEAVQRQTTLSEVEISNRKAMAAAHYAQENITPDAETLADHDLYILGKMDLEEYEQYLLLKHGHNK
ncbi:MAG: hypothetical protein Q9N67_06275 [Ghiorsea sp.]|nr:hypothetical protein [Ghiorsea sp.]